MLESDIMHEPERKSSRIGYSPKEDELDDLLKIPRMEFRVQVHPEKEKTWIRLKYQSMTAFFLKTRTKFLIQFKFWLRAETAEQVRLRTAIRPFFGVPIFH